MKSFKKEKGITLIALIITIVVLLILAGVSIGAIKDSDIITYAQDASSMYETEQNEENQMLQNYAEIIENTTNIKDNIVIIFGKYLKGEIEEEIFVEQMKQELSIETDIESWNEFFTGVDVNMDSAVGVYIYKVDKLYAMPIGEEGESNSDMIYLKEEQYKDQYRFGRSMKKIIEELERIFVGKTTTEILKLYEDEELNDWVIDNSEYIINIDIDTDNSNNIQVDELTWREGDYEVSISKDADDFPKTTYIYQENGVYYKVYMEDGG